MSSLGKSWMPEQTVGKRRLPMEQLGAAAVENTLVNEGKMLPFEEGGTLLEEKCQPIEGGETQPSLEEMSR